MTKPSFTPSSDLRSTDATLVERRFALRLAGGLTLAADALPHDVTERLRFARERAVGVAREQRRAAAAPAGVSGQGHGTLVLGAFGGWWQRAASVLPLVLLVGGLLAIQQMSLRERVLAAAEIDSQLLADDLPPSAYIDPGFAEFVRTDPRP